MLVDASDQCLKSELASYDLDSTTSSCLPSRQRCLMVSCAIEMVVRNPPRSLPLTRVRKPTSSWTNMTRNYSFASGCFNMLTERSTYSFEFGGPWGVTAMMVGFPMLMYYLWICLWFYDGQLVFPKSVDGIHPFLHEMWTHVRDVSP